MLNHSNVSYTLDNYDNVSVSCLNGDNDVPFVLFGYPESNIVVVHTKDKEDLYPTSFFSESEIGFGKESAMCKKQNKNIVCAVIAQNELDSSTTYVFECKKECDKYDWSKLEKKVLINKNQTITNSLSICSDNENNILIFVSGFDMLSDKGNCLLHFCKENTWNSVDLTELCGSHMQVGKSSQLLFSDSKYFLFVGDENIVRVFVSNDITTWTLEKTFDVENFNNLSVVLNNSDIWLSICCKNENHLYKNFNFVCDIISGCFVSSLLCNNKNTTKLFLKDNDNKVFVYNGDLNWKLEQEIKEEFDFNMNCFVDYYDVFNLLTIKKKQRSEYLMVKGMKTDNLENKIENNQEKTCVNLYHYGNTEQTKNNSQERSKILEYLFNEYFDTLDSNTFSSYRCFFLKTFLNKQDALFDTKNKNAKMYSTIVDSDKNLEFEYENINKCGKSDFYEKCMLGYVNNADDLPKTFDNIDEKEKYICFRHNGENYFPNGELKLIDKNDIQMIDLILESKVITITSLNYATIRDLTLSSLIKVHFFTHEENEEDETKYVIWKTLNGKKLEFPLMGIKDLFYNGLEWDVKVKMQVTSILEDFYFTVASKCINGDVGGNGLNELILYQMQTEWNENLFEMVNLGFKMNCNGI